MRIAIDVRSLMEGRVSGVEEYLTQLLHALARVAPQHNYHLFYNSARPVNLPRLSSHFQIHAFHYPNKFFNAFQWGLSLPRWDSLVEADCFFLPSLRLLPLKMGTPLVTTVHDLSFERFPEFFSRQRQRWHRLMKPRQLMERSNHLIAVSQATASDLQELYHIPGNKISVLHSGIAQYSDPISADALRRVRQKYNLPEKFILYLGTLEPRKNVPTIIEAFTAIASQVPHSLVLAGAEGWLTSAIENALKKSSARDRIFLPGFIAQADKATALTAAALFVYPSFYEGFGFPPLEALAAGTPVITSFNSALPEVVGKWAYLINPYEPAELALCMKEALNDPLLITEAVQQEIRETYSWDTTARKTIEVLERVTSNQPVPRRG